MTASIIKQHHGFWLIRTEDDATRATFLVGSFVCIVAAVSAYGLWSNPDKAVLLLPFSLGYVGWKILRWHARGWALLLTIVVAAINVGGLFVRDVPNRNAIELIGWSIWVLLFYGWVGAVAYRRLAAQNPFGLTHDDVVRQTKAGISVGFGTCCCLLLVLGFARFVHLQEKAIISLILMPFFLVAFVEPLLEYLNHTLGLRHVTVGAGRLKARLGVLSFGVLAVLLHSFLEEGINQAGYFTPALLLILLFVPGQITAGWIDGVEHTRSGWLGLSRGFMLGLISVWLIWLFLRHVTPQPDLWAGLRILLNPEGGETVALGGFVPPVDEPSLGWIQLAIANACNFGILGLMGGLASDCGASRRGIFMTLLATVSIEGTVLYWACVRWNIITVGDLERLLVLQFLLACGWGIGILIYPPAGELLNKHRTRSLRSQAVSV